MDATKGDCVVCQEEEVIAARIAGDTVCEDCVVNGIIPKFVNALKFEAEYPPAWGSCRLHPRDFKPYLEDADNFLSQYRMREMEYEIPIAKRLYCGNCHAFACDRDPKSLIRISCIQCKELICSGCGVVDENYWNHKCEKPKDAFEGLVMGRDFQICPNPECRASVELRDGCNAMVCPSSSCRKSFCFVCGQPAGHNSDHWKTGSKCPRFNQPGSQHQQFDRAVPANEQRPPAIPPGHPTAVEVIERLNADNGMHRLLPMVRDLRPLPPVPGVNDQGTTRLRRLQLEQNFASELLASELGILMRHQQGQIDAMLQVAQAIIIDAETDGNPVPPFLSPAINLMIKLRMNLDIYVWRERIWAGFEGYWRRHAEIFADLVHRRFRAEMREHFPMLIKIQQVYLVLAGMNGAIGLN